VVEGRLWGAMVIASRRPKSLPEDSEARLTDFAELVAMAIANAESRAALGRLAEEQAALRRVAELVAWQAPPEKVFAVVTEELSRVLGINLMARTVRFDRDGTATIPAPRACPRICYPLAPTCLSLAEASSTRSSGPAARPASTNTPRSAVQLPSTYATTGSVPPPPGR